MWCHFFLFLFLSLPTFIFTSDITLVMNLYWIDSLFTATLGLKPSVLIWTMCVGNLLSKLECMSFDWQTKLVSCHKVMCQRYMMFMHHICLYKLKLFQTPIMGNYMKLIGTLKGAFGKFEQEKSNLIILVYAIFIQV